MSQANEFNMAQMATKAKIASRIIAQLSTVQKKRPVNRYGGSH